MVFITRISLNSKAVLNYLLEHTDVYEIMCKNARSIVEDYFQWEDIMKKFDDIIKLVGEKNEAENK